VNFISAGLKKSAAEDASEEDSDEDEKPVKQEEIPKEFVPKKLKTVSYPAASGSAEGVCGTWLQQQGAGGGER